MVGHPRPVRRPSSRISRAPPPYIAARNEMAASWRIETFPRRYSPTSGDRRTSPRAAGLAVRMSTGWRPGPGRRDGQRTSARRPKSTAPSPPGGRATTGPRRTVDHMPDRAQTRARWVDGALIALAALLGGLFFVDSLANAGAGDGFPVVDPVVGLLACLALVLRRRWPVAVAAVLIPAMVLSASAMGATAVAIGAVAVYRSWRPTAVLLALHAATVASGLLVRSQRQLVASLRERAREAEERHRLQIEEARHAER